MCVCVCVCVAEIRHQMLVNPLHTRHPQTGTLVNSEDPVEMPQNTAFHPGLHCLLKNNIFERDLHVHLYL